jgi:hypothetical protein
VVQPVRACGGQDAKAGSIAVAHWWDAGRRSPSPVPESNNAAISWLQPQRAPTAPPPSTPTPPTQRRGRTWTPRDECIHLRARIEGKGGSKLSEEARVIDKLVE